MNYLHSVSSPLPSESSVACSVHGACKYCSSPTQYLSHTGASPVHQAGGGGGGGGGGVVVVGGH